MKVILKRETKNIYSNQLVASQKGSALKVKPRKHLISINPLMTHGNEFSGDIKLLNKANEPMMRFLDKWKIER